MRGKRGLERTMGFRIGRRHVRCRSRGGRRRRQAGRVRRPYGRGGCWFALGAFQRSQPADDGRQRVMHRLQRVGRTRLAGAGRLLDLPEVVGDGPDRRIRLPTPVDILGEFLHGVARRQAGGIEGVFVPIGKQRFQRAELCFDAADIGEAAFMHLQPIDDAADLLLDLGDQTVAGTGDVHRLQSRDELAHLLLNVGIRLRRQPDEVASHGADLTLQRLDVQVERRA